LEKKKEREKEKENEKENGKERAAIYTYAQNPDHLHLKGYRALFWGLDIPCDCPARSEQNPRM